MKDSKRLALLTAGPVNDMPLARLAKAVSKIGPVKAPSLGQASRTVNALKSGFAVRSIADMHAYSLYAIWAPPGQVPKLARELLDLHRDWTGRTVLLCAETLDSRDLDMFARRGADTGSITVVPVATPAKYLIEGSAEAVGRARTLLETSRASVIEIGEQQKPFYYAAEMLCSVVMLPLLEAATCSLRLAGVPLSQARPLVESLVRRSLRSHYRSGRKTWRAPSSAAARQQLDRELEALRAADPRLCRFFEESLRAALCFFEESASARPSASAAAAP